MFKFASFNTDDDNFLWVSNAMELNLIKVGQLLDVSSIKRLATGKGYLIRCDLASGESVYTMAYSNSPTGKSVKQVFEDPELLDDSMIQVKAQNKVKAAMLETRESKGTEWILSGESEEEEVLTPVLTNKRKKKITEETQSD